MLTETTSVVAFWNPCGLGGCAALPVVKKSEQIWSTGGNLHEACYFTFVFHFEDFFLFPLLQSGVHYFLAEKVHKFRVVLPQHRMSQICHIQIAHSFLCFCLDSSKTDEHSWQSSGTRESDPDVAGSKCCSCDLLSTLIPLKARRTPFTWAYLSWTCDLAPPYQIHSCSLRFSITETLDCQSPWSKIAEYNWCGAIFKCVKQNFSFIRSSKVYLI